MTMSSLPPPETTELVVVDREERHLFRTVKYDMSQIAANAQVEAAREQHGVPARQETIRTGIVAGSLVLGTAVLHALGVSDHVIVAVVLALGGGWGITSVVGKLKQPKALPPHEVPPK